MNGALYVSDSGNTKLMGSQKVDATYVAINGSCPKECPLKSNGCYGELSFTGITTSRLNVQAVGISALDLAREEAKAIDNAYAGGPVPNRRNLRLHVAGDSRTIKGTKLINSAIKRWKARGGGHVWAYTHAWANVSRDHWNNVSILASIENISEEKLVRKRGYAPALVVSEHLSEKSYKIKGSDTTWIPCPAQTKPAGKEIGCTDCGLCMKADWLYKTNRGITFAAHGIKQNLIKRKLNVIK